MSTPINDGGNAFPHAQRLWDNDAQSWAVHSVGGMTLRDYFAGKALAGWISGPCQGEALADYDGEHELFKQHQIEVAKCAYGYADAMLKAREAKQP